MLRTILKLIPVLGLTCVLVVASWEPNNFGLSYGASAPLPHHEWIDFFVTEPSPPPDPSLIDVIFPSSLPRQPGAPSLLDWITITGALVLVLLWLESWLRTPRNKPEGARKVVSKYGVCYVTGGVAAHRARHKL